MADMSTPRNPDSTSRTLDSTRNLDSTSRKAALWVALVFVLGAALGGMTGYEFAHHKYSVTNAAVRPPITTAERRAQRVQELTRDANLTPDQAQQLDAIIADIQGQIKNIRKTTDPQIDDARMRGRERIRAILTPEQRPKFEEFIQRLDAERKRNAE
jgi:Spy/CpxP family protein refolding chaperone